MSDKVIDKVLPGVNSYFDPNINKLDRGSTGKPEEIWAWILVSERREGQVNRYSHFITFPKYCKTEFKGNTNLQNIAFQMARMYAQLSPSK